MEDNKVCFECADGQNISQGSLAPEMDVKRVKAGNHQVLGALKKIGSHIGTLSKFKKASSLLRQLLDQNMLMEEQGGECFKVKHCSLGC